MVADEITKIDTKMVINSIFRQQNGQFELVAVLMIMLVVDQLGGGGCCWGVGRQVGGGGGDGHGGGVGHQGGHQHVQGHGQGEEDRVKAVVCDDSIGFGGCFGSD